jgi:hypothetical protein
MAQRIEKVRPQHSVSSVQGILFQEFSWYLEICTDMSACVHLFGEFRPTDGTAMAGCYADRRELRNDLRPTLNTQWSEVARKIGTQFQ